MSLLMLHDLCIEPVKAITAKVEAQQVIMLMGSSGSGKSRLLYAIADLLPHQGEVKLENQAATTLAPSQWRQKVMLLPSQIEWWYETAEEHFFNPPTAKELQKLNLCLEQLKEPIVNLSTGQKQRLGLLRAINRNPTILLLDEATANLDHENTLAVEAYLKEWVSQENRAIIWISHLPEQVERMADYIWSINEQALTCRTNQEKSNKQLL
ncbi:MAG: ATP-binding cassette domain-containing protein [Pseudomonadales bacterium]|nr:ATP-binding cassette domain-containing protein [Pseudomonadales bacterium]